MLSVEVAQNKGPPADPPQPGKAKSQDQLSILFGSGHRGLVAEHQSVNQEIMVLFQVRERTRVVWAQFPIGDRKVCRRGPGIKRERLSSKQT